VGIQKIVEGTKLRRLVFVGVSPKTNRLIGVESVDETFGVIDPDVAAPPLLRILDLGQNQERSKRLQNILRQETADNRLGSADVQIEILSAGFCFVDHPSYNRAADRRHYFTCYSIAHRKCTIS